MMWPFKKWLGKKDKPMPPINEDWCVGDVAVCIDGNWIGGGGPAEGSMHRVTAVIAGVSAHNKGCRVWGLGLAAWSGYWDVTAFRKVRPDANACDEEFKTWIKRVARKPQPVGMLP